jgi:hypothetical protein
VRIDSEDWSFFRPIQLPHIPNLQRREQGFGREEEEIMETFTGSPARSEKVATTFSSKGLQRMPLTFFDWRVE